MSRQRASGNHLPCTQIEEALEDALEDEEISRQPLLRHSVP